MSKMKLSYLILIVMAIMLAVLACKPNQATLQEETIREQVQGTQNALATQSVIETMSIQLTALSMPTNTPEPTELPTQTPTPSEAAPTAVINPIEEPTATTAVEPSATPVETGTQCLQMAFIEDVNVPSGTVLSPGDFFEKTWKIKNVGTCTWTLDYRLTFVDGVNFGLDTGGILDAETPPGETAEVTLSGLVAPTEPGVYYGAWMLMHPNGARFGHGPERAWGLVIRIEVKN